MDNSIYYRYHNLCLEDKVDPLLCRDVSHEIPLHPFFNFEKEQVIFECLACDYNVVPGLNMYQDMESAVLLYER